jgi:hypothetical protein
MISAAQQAVSSFENIPCHWSDEASVEIHIPELTI